MNLKLSILIPSFNDKEYIEECVNSLLDNNRKDFEIIISDDCSDEQTLSILDCIDDNRVKIVKSSIRLGASDNWKKCLSLAKGEWIHFLASDDYYTNGTVESILDSLEDKNSIYLIEHLCFDDASKEIIEVQCDREKIYKIFNPNQKTDWSNLLKFSNHDELVLCIFPRSKIEILSRISKYSTHSSFMYWVYAIFYNIKLSFIDKGAVMKRYNHKIERVKGGDLGKKTNALGIRLRGFYGDFYNSIILPFYFRDLIMILKLMFNRRYHSSHKGGFYGLTSKNSSYFYPGTLINLILSPILVLAKKFNVHKKFKRS